MRTHEKAAEKAVVDALDYRSAFELAANLEQYAWDGDWYLRAWFDDGTPLGSRKNDQCRIDSIAQSWALLSGAGRPARVARALDALDAQLVDEEAKLIHLLSPPFDRQLNAVNEQRGSAAARLQAPDPGYIAGYLPGVRENGGQYTHAAVWAVMAFAEAGRIERAWQLFDLINPQRHAADGKSAEIYKGEPYVVAGDVYANPAHRGRAGWTWYTGSAGWLYRIGLEAILGFQLRGSRLKIEPCVPSGWPGYEITYRYGSATYHVVVENSSRSGRGIRSLTLDGQAVPGGAIDLANDGQRHEVGVTTATRQEEQSVRAAG